MRQLQPDPVLVEDGVVSGVVRGRDPAELAAEDALAVLIGHCPCGGKLAAVGVLGQPSLTFFRCQVCRRQFGRKEVGHGG
ncbi:MAG TPA: hypothetical protein VJ140_10195 [Actinomycetota bacterium]|nr:hypothetical protein [Actinomycetota bacterium]